MNYGKIFLVVTCCICAACTHAQQGKHAVQNFGCVLYNWEDYMICSWTLADKNVDNVSVRYKITNNDWQFCFLSQDKTSCKICGTSGKSGCLTLSPLAFFQWDFSVTVELIKQSFQLRPADYVKPAPVEALKVENVDDPECIKLSWKNNANGDTIVQIKYIMEWDKNITKEVNATRNHVEICGLIPHTKYTFDVSAIPEKGGYFSNKVTKLYMTPESVPAAAPPVAIGSFEREINSCINRDNFHNVTVYWKEIPKRFHYGEIIGYNLNIVTHRNFSVGNVLQSKITLMCDRAYEVEIRARTKKGVSPYAASIFIPRATDKILTPPEVMIILDRNRTQYLYNISWTDTAITHYDDYNYTVHYCNKGVLSCKGELQSITVQSTDKYFLLEQSHFVHLRIGVSMDHGLQSSGVLFTSCIYNKTGVPATPKGKDIDVTPVPDNSLTVTWTETSKCDGVLPHVTLYRVWWCELQLGRRQCTGTETSKDVMAKRSTSYRYVIPDLKEGAQYGVRLQALSAYRESNKSVMKIATPENSDLPAYFIVIIVAVIVFVVILGSVGLYYFYRCCRNGKRDLKALNEVDFPDIEHRLLEPESSQNSALLSSHGHVTNMTSDRNPLLLKVKFKKNGEEKLSLDSGRGSLPTQDSENGLEASHLTEIQVSSLPTVQGRKRNVNDELPVIVRNLSSFDDIRQPGHYSLFAAIDDSSGEPSESKHLPGSYAVCNVSSGAQQHQITENVQTFLQSSENIVTSDNNETYKISNQSTALQTFGSSISDIPPTAAQEHSLLTGRKLDETLDKDTVMSLSSQSSSSMVTSGDKVIANKGSNSLPDYVKESLTCSSDDDTAEISKVSETSFINSSKKDFSVRFSDLNDISKKKEICDENI